MTLLIEAQLDELFVLTQKLARSLSEDNFSEFQIMEALFSSKTRQFIDNNEQQVLLQVLPQLEKLEQLMHIIQIDAQKKQSILKQQSLSQKRNKGRLNAYQQHAKG